MDACCLVLPDRREVDALAGYVADRIRRGEGIVLVTVHHAPRTLREHLQRLEVPHGHLSIVDARGEGMAIHEDGVHFVPSPTLLELITLRARQLARKYDKPHVVVDDCEGLALHNPAPAVEEYVKYVADHVARPGLPVDFVRCEPSHLDPDLQRRLHRILPTETRWPPSAAAA